MREKTPFLKLWMTWKLEIFGIFCTLVENVVQIDTFLVNHDILIETSWFRHFWTEFSWIELCWLRHFVLIWAMFSTDAHNTLVDHLCVKKKSRVRFCSVKNGIKDRRTIHWLSKIIEENMWKPKTIFKCERRRCTLYGIKFL